jgi:SAM-dependent methyltransferase
VTPIPDFATIYDTADPWGIKASRVEQERLERTLRPLARCHFTNGLDVACGEGVLTGDIASICDHAFGVDVSPTAIARAKEDQPHIQFAVADLEKPADWPDIPPPDLMVCTEALYYTPPPRRDEVLDGLLSRGAPGCVYLFSVVVRGGPPYFSRLSAMSLFETHMNVLRTWAVSPNQSVFMGVKR